MQELNEQNQKLLEETEKYKQVMNTNDVSIDDI